MRIVVDLQACQTEGSRGRGVGRYAEGLVRAMGPRLAGDELRACANGGYPESIAELTAAVETSLPRERLSVYHYPPLARQLPGERNASVQAAEALVRGHWSSLQPDVLHLSHVFEGLGGRAVVPQRLPAMPGLVRSATLYDLIPLRFPDWYFADPRLKRWYHEKIAVLRQCDHLLAISEATRADAIELLGVAPSRVSTIWGGVDESFAPGDVAPGQAATLRRRHGLRERFLLYTGGDEYRKNLEGALAGFALVPGDVRRGVQFVVVCAMSDERRRELARKAERLGIDPDGVAFTGFVPHDELVALYRLCEAFVFPSLYEGLGLPVLEAMRCGAAAVGGDNSSIRELIDRADARFDARSAESMAQVLSRVLCDRGFRDALRAYGLLRGREFGWDRSAGLTLDALRDAHARLQPSAPVVAAARLPKRRLAVFTPLPPCRSGIADYNAAFLPWLDRYFDIDVFVDGDAAAHDGLQESFRVFDHATFAARRSQYDAVLYDFGNSSFHAYMLDALARFPGIVVLHDAYLSGLYRHAEFHVGRAGWYTGAMLHAHGPRARRYLAPVQRDPDAAESSMVNLPATKQVIESAIGLISHSPFNVEVARANYPEGWRAPYRVVPQMVQPAPPASAGARARARQALGIDADDFVVCSFGHVAWTKCGDLLLAAFERSAAGATRAARLVFVGELTQDRFGDELRQAIAASAAAARIAVTGYVDDCAYRQYLAAADVAVQLRVNSRGGTPKGVLDCLARGIPVVLNDAASYTDYPPDVVIKIAAVPDASSLATVLDRLHADRDGRLRIGARGRKYVAHDHGPEQVAARYALTIDEFIQRAGAASLSGRVRDVAEALARAGAPAALVDEAASILHASAGESLFPRRRLLIDVSHLVAEDHGTGIPRVVKNIVRWVYCSNRAGFEPVAVKLARGRLVEATAWLDAQGLLLPGEGPARGEHEVLPRRGDCLLMLDSSWARIDEFLPLYDSVRSAGGTVCTVVYDLLPIQFPQYMVEGGPEWFRGWLEQAVAASDGLICISRAVADDLATEIERAGLRRERAVPIGYWHLGADFHGEEPRKPPTPRIARAFARAPLLMVGSIDPRKNHALVLDAFERLWARGEDAHLCIAGKPGWSVEALVARIERHPELGCRLHYVLNPTDDELAFCYWQAGGLLFASSGEGFGLPLVEAARWGLPLLVADVPVLREVAGAHASYFALGSPDDVAEAIARWLDARARGEVPASDDMRCLTWEESAEALLRVVLDAAWYRRVGGSAV